MGSIVAVKGMLSMIAERMADTHSRSARPRRGTRESRTQSAIDLDSPVCSAPATTMNSIMKKTRVGHSTSFSTISTMCTPLITSRRDAPARAAMLGSMCRGPLTMNIRIGEGKHAARP